MPEKKVVQYKLVRHKWPDELHAQRVKRMRIAGVMAACILCFAGGFGVSIVYNKSSVISDPTFSRLSEVYSIMSNKFYFGKEQDDFNQKLIDGAVEGMVKAGGDTHTMYMDQDQSTNFTSTMEGSFVGIGVQFYEQSEDAFVVTRVYKNSPAQEAGMMKGDIIYSINGTICQNMDAERVKELIVGDTGSKVELDIIRENEHIKKSVERREIMDTVYSETSGNVGTIELTTFADTSGNEFGSHMEDIIQAGCDTLILDLRDNTGGYLISAQQIASYLLGEDEVIFKEESKDGKIVDYKTLSDYPHYTFNKILVLVNGNTASAAEVLTATLQEHLDATIIGTKTYGKGTVQVPLPFNDGSMLKYTVAEWLTPSGDKINDIGITPDEVIELDAAFTTLAPKLDDDESYHGDSVNVAARSVQTYLRFLGYSVDRTDEYFSLASSEALKQYQRDKGVEATGVINADIVNSLLSSVSLTYHDRQAEYDLQMKKAVELADE